MPRAKIDRESVKSSVLTYIGRLEYCRYANASVSAIAKAIGVSRPIVEEVVNALVRDGSLARRRWGQRNEWVAIPNEDDNYNRIRSLYLDSEDCEELDKQLAKALRISVNYHDMLPSLYQTSHIELVYKLHKALIEGRIVIKDK